MSRNSNGVGRTQAGREEQSGEGAKLPDDGFWLEDDMQMQTVGVV